MRESSREMSSIYAEIGNKSCREITAETDA